MICKVCLGDKEEAAFRLRTCGKKTYFAYCCRKCENKRRQQLRKDSGYYKSDRYLLLSKKARKKYYDNPNNRSKCLIRGYRRQDKLKVNSGNDLDEIFVKHVLSKECHYCGNKINLMTLDRIDNSKPHNQDNVLPCCIRCNLIRRSIPYDAWECIAKGMREAESLGLLLEYDKRFLNHGKKKINGATEV